MIDLPQPHRPGSYMDWLAGRPCICCARLGLRNTPVILHHLHVWGLPRKRGNPVRDYVTVPLCPRHHDDTGDRHAAHRMQQEDWLAYWELGGADDLLGSQMRTYAVTRWLDPPPGLSARQLAEWLLERE